MIQLNIQNANLSIVHMIAVSEQDTDLWMVVREQY